MATETEQAPTGDSEIQTAQSIEDKLAKGFEADEAANQPATKADKAETTEGTETATLEEVELDGATYQVPAALKEAIIHKSDYTRKTQEVAEARRHIELQGEAFKLAQAESAFSYTISEPLQNLALLDARTKDLLANWSSLTTDQKQEVLFLDKQRDQINAEIRNKRGEFERGQSMAMQELRTKCAEAVRKSIPGWSEDLAKEITSHAKADGYTDQELSSISDPRHVKTLWKAREYDRLQAKAKAPAQKAPVVVKPGASNPMPSHVKDKFAFQKEMAKATTESQKARLIEARFAKQFER